MDIKTLYSMVRATADSASKALDPVDKSTQNFFEVYGGYPIYVEHYNRYQQLTIDLFGNEAKVLFPQLNPISWTNPANVPGVLWRTRLEDVTVRLGTLAAYLQSKLGEAEQCVQSIIDLIETHFRPSIYDDPEKEKVVQDVLETIFRARSLPFLREKVHISYSSTTFVPDFTFDILHLVVETKLCNREGREKAIIDEVNADILAYQTKYKSLIFVVYDLGFIRDVAQFKVDIEKNPDVYAIVIKK